MGKCIADICNTVNQNTYIFKIFENFTYFLIFLEKKKKGGHLPLVWPSSTEAEKKWTLFCVVNPYPRIFFSPVIFRQSGKEEEREGNGGKEEGREGDI